MPVVSHRSDGFAACLHALGTAIVELQVGMEAAGADLLRRGLTEAGTALLSGSSGLDTMLGQLARHDPATHQNGRRADLPLQLVRTARRKGAPNG